MIEKTGNLYQDSNIDILNEGFKEVELTSSEEKTLKWLAGYEESSIKNIVSAIKKIK